MRHLFLSAHTVFLSLTLLFTAQSMLQAEPMPLSAQTHGTLHLPKFPTFKLYDNSSITFQSSTAYQQVIDRWQTKLHKGCEKLFNCICEELEITPEKMHEQFYNPTFIARYHILKKAELITQSSATFIEEEDADEEIIAFIKNFLHRHTTKRNVKIILTDALTTLTATYGSDLHEHYLFCHMHIYTKDNIKKYYHSMNDENKFFYTDHFNKSIRWIDMSNLLILGIIEASANIQHQTNLLTFLISHRNHQSKQASPETVRLCCRIHEFLSLLEAIFQSVNPLESALFLMKSPNRSPEDKKMWKTLVKDIAQSYSIKSLKQFKEYAQQIKEQSL